MYRNGVDGVLVTERRGMGLGRALKSQVFSWFHDMDSLNEV